MSLCYVPFQCNWLSLLVGQILDDYIKSGLFPRSLLSAEMLWNGVGEDETEEILAEQNGSENS
jgi:hypothetical protein